MEAVSSLNGVWDELLVEQEVTLLPLIPLFSSLPVQPHCTVIREPPPTDEHRGFNSFSPRYQLIQVSSFLLCQLCNSCPNLLR